MAIRIELRIFNQIVTSASFHNKNGNPPQNAGTEDEVQLGPRYEGQLNPMAEPIPHEVRPLVRTHVYHPYHAADRQAETDN